MQPIFFVLAIMGCGDDQQMCAEARVEPVRYATVQQCQAALPAALARNTDLSFPVISAACRANGPQWVSKSEGSPRG
ncbi:MULTISPECIES: hypothetical protein [unclassified Sphingomonas]|uniref:hypothetical protein n=1 Tax=unclassified Sphingomonas TaxID=196159 RepID=UPI001D102D1F|nr:MULTISPECIES: hypothetical protein [unclassified Sphingomonas]MCC2980091.1 hypothetical protein [Sphingomonas sp. IC4-52]MCD2314842.1 hypothetical protein [Sphingomonas sp. IC-11]